jgi:hypothetical protein
LSGGAYDRIDVPAELRTNGDFCSAVGGPTTLTMVLGRGALGHAWIRQLRVAGKSWSSG